MELAPGREAPRSSAADEEAVKRNTDCVYFLASPLTCKKGNECEFRHSEGARFNPRDCWYWLNSNCLNPKCSFRHPPLDGVFGTQGNTAAALSSLQPTVSTFNPAAQPSANNTSKQIAPCYYFKKGQCLKGERCPFMHGPQASSSDLSPLTAMVFPSNDEPLISNKDARSIKQYGAQGIYLQQNAPKVYLDRPNSKPSEPTKVHVNKITAVDDIVHTSNPSHLQNKAPVHVGHSLRKSQIHERLHSGTRRETGQLLGDSSPGGVRNSNYFDNKGNLRRLSTQDGRNLNPEGDNEYKPNDYNMMAKFEKKGYSVKGEHNQNGQSKHVSDREQATSSHKISARLERRIVQRTPSSIEMDGPDLRLRLLKQKRLSSSRSDHSPDHDGKQYWDSHNSEDKKHDHHGHRDQKQASYESSISNRLRGRINFPQRSRSPEIPTNIQNEGERDKRHIGRVSPGRPLNHQIGHNRTLKQRSDLPRVARNTRSQISREEDIGAVDFAGPKSLAEIKSVRTEESIHDLPTKNAHSTAPSVLRKFGNIDENLDSDNSVSFEGPKPLSAILKRKREMEYSDGGGDRQQDKRVIVEPSFLRAVSNSLTSLQDKKEVINDVKDSGDKFRVGEKQEQEQEEEQEEYEEGIVPTEEGELMYDDHPAAQDEEQGDVVEEDYGMELDTVQDEEPESYEQGDGESDYNGLEQTEDADTYQGDEDEFDDDDDDDDFARKLGVVYS